MTPRDTSLVKSPYNLFGADNLDGDNMYVNSSSSSSSNSMLTREGVGREASKVSIHANALNNYNDASLESLETPFSKSLPGRTSSSFLLNNYVDSDSISTSNSRSNSERVVNKTSRDQKLFTKISTASALSAPPEELWIEHKK